MVLQATLVRSSHNPSRGKSSCGTCEYVYYSIHVRDGDQEWLLHRRYSDFWRLDKELQKRNPPIKLGLPEKGVLGIFKLFGGGPRYDELEANERKHCPSIWCRLHQRSHQLVRMWHCLTFLGLHHCHRFCAPATDTNF